MSPAFSAARWSRAAVALLTLGVGSCPLACDAPAQVVSAAAEPAKADAPTGGAGKADEGFVPLFNGKDTAGWVVTGCKVAVETGALVLVEGNGLVRSEKMYGDFVLDLEWKNRKPEKFDSGVYFRADKLKPGKRYPDKYQINLLEGEEGSIVTNKQVKVVGEGKVKGLAKAGEWNRMRLSCAGTKAELEVNGKPAWKVDGIAPSVGFIGLQCEVTGGGQFEFRNVKIKAVTPPVAADDE